jgi:hypothetical protein
VVLVKEIQSFDQHHPGASRHPSSAEEGSFLPRSAAILSNISQEKEIETVLNFVPNASESGELFIQRSFRRIIEGPMDRLGAGKNGTFLLCSIANSNHVVESLVRISREIFGNLVRDIDSDFLHDFNRAVMQLLWMRSRTEYVEPVPGFLAKQTFGHLAAG